MTRKFNYLIMFWLFACLASVSHLIAQNLTLPDASQEASVSQTIGITNIKVWYHSPGVKGREIWGKIVPYDQVWRAGANENTTINLSHDVKIEGKSVKAGTYGLFLKPTKSSWELQLSKFSKSWGTVVPKEDELVLKVSLSPEESQFREYLTYEFLERNSNSTVLALQWEKIKIPIKIDVDVENIVVESLRSELKGRARFDWRGYSQAANYCLNNNVNLEEAMEWVDNSIRTQKNFTNLQIKSRLLAKKGKKVESDALMKEALDLANGNELNRYGYQLLGKNETKKAIEVFSLNIKKNKSHVFYWGFIDSLGEAYLKDGNKKMALKYYKMAKEHAPENQHKYLDGVIKSIESQS